MIRSSFSLLLDQAVFSGSSFLITLLLAQRLDIGIFGQFSGYVLINYLLISTIGSFSIQPFQVMLIRMQNAGAYTSFTFWLHFSIVILLAMAGMAVHIVFPSSFPLSLLLFTSGFLIHDFGRRLLLALNRPAQTLLYDAIVALLSLLALFSGIHTAWADLQTLFLLLSLPYLASCILLYLFIKPTLPKLDDLKRFSRSHWHEGKWLFLTSISQWWSGNLFVVASGIYLGAHALAALRLAQSLMGVLNMLLQTFENYLLPQTARRMHPANEVGLAYLSRTSRLAAVMFLPLLAAVFFFAEPLMAFAGGPAYVGYAFTLQGMSLLYLLIFMSQPVRLALRALLLHQQFFIGYLLSLAFAILTSHILLSSYGLHGVLIGLSTSQVILMTYWTIVLKNNNISIWKSFISY